MRRGTRLLLLSLPFAATVGLLAWLSGPPEFDFLDGTEFAVCARELGVPHPPGYPLYLFLLRGFSLLPHPGRVDYGCLRMLNVLLAAAGTATAASVIAASGGGLLAALLGSFLFFTLGTVMDQMNLLEVHGLSILLALAAIRLRASRCGPYVFSLSVFGGHPVSLLLAPVLTGRRILGRWTLLAVIPASLWLFVPVRSTWDALCHYSRPGTSFVFWKYLTLYGGKFTGLSTRAAEALLRGAGPVSLVVLLVFIVLSGRIRWRLLSASAAAFLFLSFYYMGDTNSLLWVPLLPLALWAAEGIGRLASRGRTAALLAVAMVTASAVTGTARAWRGNDASASVLARDLTRGVGFEGVYITIGFTTFNTAYLLDVLDYRPDILPMDEYECYFRIPPPPFYPAEVAGRTVYTNRGWDQTELSPRGLLFTASPAEVDWSDYDLFRLEGPVHDGYPLEEIRDAWLKRLVQVADPGEFRRCLDSALVWWDRDELGERIERLHTRGLSRLGGDDIAR